METAVDGNRRAGRKVEVPQGDSGNGFPNVIRHAPAPDGRKPFRDPAIISFPDRTRHVCFDNARSDFIDGDSVLSQSDSEQGGHHAETGLGDTIFTP